MRCNKHVYTLQINHLQKYMKKKHLAATALCQQDVLEKQLELIRCDVFLAQNTRDYTVSIGEQNRIKRDV